MMNSMRELARLWNQFWFVPAGAERVALCRIAIGAVASLQFIGYLAFGGEWFGVDGWFDRDAGLYFIGAEVPGTGSEYRWSFLYTAPRLLTLIAGAGLIASIAMLLGIGSRLSPVIAWLALIQFHHRAPLLVATYEPLLSAMLAYMVVDTGRVAWTFKPGWYSGPPRISANLALRLVQCHLWFWIAFSSAHLLSNPAWWNGSAIGALIESGASVFAFEDRSHWLLQAATHCMWILPIVCAIGIVHPDSRSMARIPYHLWLVGIAALWGEVMYAICLFAFGMAIWPIGISDRLEQESPAQKEALPETQFVSSRSRKEKSRVK
jgi:hypothetical protein